MKTERLYTLFQYYVEQSISSKKKDEFLKALADPSNADILKKWIGERWEKENLPERLSHQQSQELYKYIRKDIFPKKKAFHLTFWHRTAAAVILIAAILSGAYFIRMNKQMNKHKIAAQIHDVKAPVASLAKITLSNGRTIYVDSLKKGTLSLHKGLMLVKTNDGHILYKGTSAKMTYNTLSNPKRSKTIYITLPDGTKVWLNAASNLRYPTVFKGNERKVDVSGEAYFEVERNPKKPFIVNINNKEQLKVLGTHFNVNAYKDDNLIKTTLLEGSVEVSSSSDQVVLKPGEQVRQNKHGKMHVAKVDVNKVIAWKNNMFYFNNTKITCIMKTLSRWYDIDVEYKSNAIKELAFGGIISRRANVSSILDLMKQTGTVNFKIDGNNVIVEKGN